MKVAVVDTDDTLVFGGIVSNLMWTLSFLFQRLGRRLQHADFNLVSRLRDYDRIIILTSRDLKDAAFTRRQLEGNGIRVDELICCPRKQVLTQWKISVVQQLAQTCEVEWIDDVFEEGFVVDLPAGIGKRIKLLRPDALSPKKLPRSSADIERL